MNARATIDATAVQSHLDHAGQYFLMSYVGGRLVTCGAYGSPRDVMNCFARDEGGDGVWIEYAPFKWRSGDGRHLIGMEFTPAERVVVRPL